MMSRAAFRRYYGPRVETDERRVKDTMRALVEFPPLDASPEAIAYHTRNLEPATNKWDWPTQIAWAARALEGTL